MLTSVGLCSEELKRRRKLELPQFEVTLDPVSSMFICCRSPRWWGNSIFMFSFFFSLFVLRCVGFFSIHFVYPCMYKCIVMFVYFLRHNIWFIYVFSLALCSLYFFKAKQQQNANYQISHISDFLFSKCFMIKKYVSCESQLSNNKNKRKEKNL